MRHHLYSVRCYKKENYMNISLAGQLHAMLMYTWKGHKHVTLKTSGQTHIQVSGSALMSLQLECRVQKEKLQS